jgi:hypothetical protein
MMKDYLSKPEINFAMSIFIPIVMFGVGWGIMTTRLDHVERMTVGLQDQVELQRKTNAEISVRLAEIQKDILYIRDNLDKHIGK